MNYRFDNLRGLLIWCIPISHFTRVGGDFSQASLSGIVYITINVFVMEAFVFLSGYFSKKPDRARETSYKTFLLPYLVWTFILFSVQICLFWESSFKLSSSTFCFMVFVAIIFLQVFIKGFDKN